MSFIPVESKNEMKAKKATLKEWEKLLSAASHSPNNAPKNGPIMIPHGGRMNRPAMVPIIAPRVACLEPPPHLVNQAGAKLSAIVTIIVKMVNKKIIDTVTSAGLRKRPISKATTLSGGPGSTGAIEPMIAIVAKTTAPTIAMMVIASMKF